MNTEPMTTDSPENSAEVGIDVRHLVRCSEDLMYAARRVRNKYGRGKNDDLLDWTEWTDVDDAATAIEAILEATAVLIRPINLKG